MKVEKDYMFKKTLDIDEIRDRLGLGGAEVIEEININHDEGEIEFKVSDNS